MKKFKKILSFLLCIVMVLSFVAVGGENFVAVFSPLTLKADAATTYKFGDYTYTLSSAGAIITNGPTSATSNSTIIIPSSLGGYPVVAIGPYSFAYFLSGVKNIIIPNTVQIIYDRAFLDCTDLENVTLGNNVVYILNGAFANCINLKSLNIPNSVTLIDDMAFSNCPKLESVYYDGTASQKNNLQIGLNNDNFISSNWVYSHEKDYTISDYKAGDIIQYGWYPQSEVTNNNIISSLNELAGDNKTWTSYNYYTGNDSIYDGQIQASDFMRYIDIVYESNKYRGVIFDSFRPYSNVCSSSASGSYQDDNNYSVNTVYWFRFEPIEWRVLNPNTGMVISETILDSQAFNNFIISSGKDEKNDSAYWGNSEKTFYANNYEKSSIREWLNKDFYNLSFSKEQQEIINFTEIENKAYDKEYSHFDSNSTYDKIYLISYDEALDESFFPTNKNRVVTGSDYAKCQGLSSTTGKANFILRSAGNASGLVCHTFIDGSVSYMFYAAYTYCGIRPVLNFNPNSEISQSNVKSTGLSDSNGMSYLHNHSYSDVVTAPTCDKMGYTTHICSCGDSYVDNYVNALGHSFTNYVYNHDATPDSDGTETAKCDRCSATDVRTKAGTKLTNESTVVKIRNMSKYNGKTVDYRSSITFYADIDNGILLDWVVIGADYTKNADGSCTVNQAKGDFTIYNQAMDKNGKIVNSETETVKVKHGFFDKLIAFFKGLFGTLPKITQ